MAHSDLYDHYLVKLGMAGNMASYRFESTSGGVVDGRGVSYNGSPAGYASAWT